jgi:phage shock protein PspC (stress-responsive transcriptional regulator)
MNPETQSQKLDRCGNDSKIASVRGSLSQHFNIDQSIVSLAFWVTTNCWWSCGFNPVLPCLGNHYSEQ